MGASQSANVADVYCAISNRAGGISRVVAWDGIVKFEELVLGFGDIWMGRFSTYFRLF